MGLIINDKIQQLMIGYPTVSDKYNVRGAVLSGLSAVNFGDVVINANGGFQAFVGGVTADDIAGFAVATNVKLAEDWPGKTVQVNPGEAFNLLVDGFIAVELVNAAAVSDVKPNAPVHITTAGKICGKSRADSFAVPNATFTGLYEQQGTKYVAEIYVR